MNSTGNSDIQRIIAEQAAAMPLHRRAVDHTVAAVITVEGISGSLATPCTPC